MTKFLRHLRMVIMLFLFPPQFPSHALRLSTLTEARHYRGGKLIGYRRVWNKKVTAAFCNLLADALQASTDLSTFKYHASGTGVTAEANTDTVMGTQAETRDEGTQIEGASTYIYKSVATHTFADTFAITEHGLFSASSGGTLMDRSVFAAINVVAADRIEWTYQLTITPEA